MAKNYEFMLSMRMYLEAQLGDRVNGVYLLRDDVDLTTRKKPFVTVGYLDTGSEILSAGRRSYRVEHRQVIDVFASDAAELLRLSDELDVIVKRPEGIPLMDELGRPTGVSAYADAGAFTPVPNDDTSSETYNHHGSMPVTFETTQKLI